MLFRRRILYSGFLGGPSHLVSRDFISFLKSSANGGRAKKCEQEKQLGRRRKGYRKFPPLSSLFFPPLFFSFHLPLPKCLEQARDFKGLHLFVESPVGWGIPLSKGAWRRSPAPSGSNLAVAVALVDP